MRETTIKNNTFKNVSIISELNINIWLIAIKIVSLGDKYFMIRTVFLINMALLYANMHV